MKGNKIKGVSLAGRMLTLILSVLLALSPMGSMTGYALEGQSGIDAAEQTQTEEEAQTEKEAPAEESVDAAEPEEAAETAGEDSSVQGAASEEEEQSEDVAEPETVAEPEAAKEPEADAEQEGETSETKDNENVEDAEKVEDAKDVKDAEDISQTVTVGDAVITAEYKSDIFDEDVKLKVRELRAGSGEFKKAEEAAGKLIKEKSTEALFAYDITFLTSSGRELEPADNVKVSIRLKESPADRKLTDLNLVHIKDNGKAEKLEEAKINKDATKVEFENDAFSVYVVVNYYDYSVAGSYTIQGDEDTYDTLQDAIDNVMSSGEIIVVSDDTTEEGGQTLGGWDCRIVPGDKDVTITFNGDLTIDDDFDIGGVNSSHKITVVVTGDFTLEDGARLTIGKEERSNSTLMQPIALPRQMSLLRMMARLKGTHSRSLLKPSFRRQKTQAVNMTSKDLQHMRHCRKQSKKQTAATLFLLPQTLQTPQT